MAFFVLFLLTLPAFAGADFAQRDQNTARDLHMKAVHADILGLYDEARKNFLQEADLLLAKNRPAEAGVVYTELAESAQIHGAFSSSELTYKKSLGLLQHSVPPNDLHLVLALDDLGWLYVTWGRLADGFPLLDQARINAEGAPPNDPGLIRHLDTQAAYMVIAGKYSEARKYWNRAIEIGKANYGPDRAEYDNVFVHLGQASVLFGDYDLAEQMLRRYLEIEDRVSKKPTVARAVAAAELGHLYAQLRKYTEAQRWFEEAAMVFDQHPGQAPLPQSMFQCYLGDFYMGQREWSKAEWQYRQALSIQQKVLGQNRAVAASMISLSKALKKLHLKDEAKKLVARAQAIIAAARSPLQGQTVDVLALRRQ